MPWKSAPRLYRCRLISKLHQYLLELQSEFLPKSPSGAAVRYARNQWEALTRFDGGGKTAAVLRSFSAFLQAVRRRAVCLVP